MTKLRCVTSLVASLLLAGFGVLAAGPAAFATRVVPPGDPGPTTPTYIVTQTGMAGWQVALIAIGAALGAVALTAIVVRVRFRTRPHPLAG